MNHSSFPLDCNEIQDDSLLIEMLGYNSITIISMLVDLEVLFNISIDKLEESIAYGKAISYGDIKAYILNYEPA